MSGNPSSPWRTAATAGLVIAVVNTALLGIGHLLSADMLVAPTAAEDATEVGLGSVLLMSTAPTVAGGLALWLAARRGERARRAVGWLGLAIGVATLPMPIAVTASAGTSATLASMHLAAGLAWLFVVYRSAGRRAAVPDDEQPVHDPLQA